VLKKFAVGLIVPQRGIQGGTVKVVVEYQSQSPIGRVMMDCAWAGGQGAKARWKIKPDLAILPIKKTSIHDHGTIL
jgi:hypothetical protein